MTNRSLHPLRRFNTTVSRRSALALLTQAGLWAQDDVIKVDVERVNVLFSVRDRKGAFINNLTQDDFDVREDGKPQEIRTFARETDLPLTIGMLIDVSVSQQRLIEEERRAGSQFFRQVLRQKDVAFLITFGSEAELLQDSTGSTRLLERALGEVRVSGPGAGGIVNPGPIPQSNPRGTILYDAVYLGASEKLATEVGRKALILVTDGVDQGSRVKLAEAVEAALRSDALVYGIYYVDPAFYGFGYGGGGESTLKRMAEDTGGRFFRVERNATLESIFQQIEQEMRSQYALSYSSSNPARDGSFRKLEIKTKNKDYRVQARKGYFAPKS
jgi:VWFA-related protein